jgi:hypothetical protein
VIFSVSLVSEKTPTMNGMNLGFEKNQRFVQTGDKTEFIHGSGTSNRSTPGLFRLLVIQSDDTTFI